MLIWPVIFCPAAGGQELKSYSPEALLLLDFAPESLEAPEELELHALKASAARPITAIADDLNQMVRCLVM